MPRKKKQCDGKGCDLYYDDLNWVCEHCDQLVDPDNPPYHSATDNKS